MGAQRTSFEKLQRDRAKKAKAAMKRERRQGRASAPESEPAPQVALTDDDRELTAPELLALVEELHRQFKDEEIGFEEFEERKIELMARLPVD